MPARDEVAVRSRGGHVVRVGLVRRVAAVLAAAVVAMATAAPAVGAPPAPSPMPADAPIAPSAAPSALSPAAPLRNGDYIPGHVLVRFAPGTVPSAKGTARRAAEAGLVRAFGLVRNLELLRTRLPVDVAIERLRTMPGVLYAEPDWVIHADLTPNDPLLGQLWGLDQASDADIDAEAAWDTSTGAGVVVAVVDSGMELDHPDLAANLWTNPGEVAGNGIDDDDDGYVDDVHGWDFIADDAVPADEFGHGTHVAGTIAAVGDNGIGVVGVAFDAQLMPLRVLNSTGFGSISGAVRALDYATRHGARVSNNSWVWAGGESQPLADAIAAAGDAGQVVVAAAGNDAQDNDVSPHWPANYDLPNLLTVAATTDADQLAGFSDVGARTVDLGAPGLAIRSTWPGGGYALLDGTSMAAPHVAGVAALVLAAHPGWTAAEVRERILRTARPIAALDGVTATGGVVNAAAAVATSPDLAPRIEITAPTKGASVLPGADVTFTATADDPEDGDLAASIAWRSSLQGPLGTGSSITVSDLEEGSHLVTATVVDTAGHAPLASIVVRVGPSVGPIEASPDLRTPAIAVTPAGEPAVAWVEHGVGTIVARETGGTWSPQVVSRAYLETWPDLGAAPDGTLHLLVQREWSSVGVFDDSGILSAVDDGSGWSTTRVTQSCTDDGQGCGEDWTPAFALDPSGRAHAAFVRAKGQSPGLYHAWEHADGSWSSERVLPIASGIGRPDLAVDADGAVHLSYARSDGTSAGVYHATDASGSWIVERLSTSVGAWAVSIAAGDGGRLDVAWATDSGLRQRTRSGGTWGAPVTVSAAPAMTVDLVRMGAALHLVAGLVDASHTAVGVAYGINMGTGWTLTTIASGQDMEPRLAVDAGGHAHVAYRHAWPASEIRYATDATGSWVTTAVRRGWSDEAPATAVDADGVAHVAFGRFGTDPGVYVGSDEGGSWSIGRLTEVPPDGGVGIAARPDGTLAVAWGEYVAADGTPLADRGVYVATGSPGAWTTVRIATETVTTGHVVAADADGHLHVAWSTVSAGGNERIAYATDASGSWVTSTVTPGPSDREPSIAVEATGAVHIAFAHGGGSSPISYATNRTGGWVVSTLTSGFRDSTPSIALDPAGLPRIAFARDGGGVRLLAFDGSAWSSTTLSANALDVSPVVAVDDAGHQHVLYARASYAYDVCVIPLCPAYPGMRYATDETGSWATQRVTDLGNDLPTAIVCGPDGSISGVYLSAGIGIGAVRLVRAPDPGPTALVVDAPDAAPRLTTVTLAAVLTSGALPVYGRTVTFTVDGDAVGTAKTDRAGVASLRHALVEALGSRSVGATFAGDRLHAGSSAVPTTIEVQDLPAPTATAPVVHLPTGIALTQGKATVRVTFGGSNAAAYRLERSIAGGPWAAIGAATASRTRDVLVLPSQTTRIRFRVVPLTAGGAAGATVAGSSFRVWTVAERPSSALTYTGSWPVSTGPAYFGGSARHASAATARVTFRFTGREVAWIAATGPTRGSARVYVDGRYAGTVSLRASSAAYRRLVFRRAFATSGTHTIQLRVVGNGRVDVDGFVVLG